jgi:GR25 family glycosyltransferase involved in LPS biosynthesis
VGPTAAVRCLAAYGETRKAVLSPLNIATRGGFLSRLRQHAVLLARLMSRSRSTSFGSNPHDGVVHRVYVINLDRRPDRWRSAIRELRRIRDVAGTPLMEITRRFSAIDARHLGDSPIAKVVNHEYSLADQLFVQPNPLLRHRVGMDARRIYMTAQEVAVALSHIELWRLIAAGDALYTLVLEDDAYFTRSFAGIFDKAWAEVMNRRVMGLNFDLLYLSYQEAGGRAPRLHLSDVLFEPITGLWNLSGYVLSRNGAQRLLDLLPVRGPVDLWMNHQFRNLDALATRRSIIQQRLDCPSTNSYSVLPILSEVGVLTREKPLVVRGSGRRGPVFAYGREGSGATALAMALSMLGYRCCSDVSELPPSEHLSLFGGERDRIFDAYVNVGSVNPSMWVTLARRYRNARFILLRDDGTLTALESRLTDMSPGVLLVMPAEHRDKWQLLSDFLECEYPVHAYPDCGDQTLRQLGGPSSSMDHTPPPARWMKCDRSPWVAPRIGWEGIAHQQSAENSRPFRTVVAFAANNGELAQKTWWLRDDTFPSNMSLFSPHNVTLDDLGFVELILREEKCSVRDYTSGSIASRNLFTYGRFIADIKPARVRGLITGMFLHRNAPRQEIDIEFLGKDPTKMLVNVYYNPGQPGTKLEYGYRGVPAVIDLGFDASEDFHRYEIEWRSDAIRWRVDGQLVHKRVNWSPTPIPHLPMQFNLNLWHSRSRELAGRLPRSGLPARAGIRYIQIDTEVEEVPKSARSTDGATTRAAEHHHAEHGIAGNERIDRC